MTGDRTNIMEINKTIPSRIGRKIIGGDSFVNKQGRWTARLDVTDDAGERQVHVYEGETFEFNSTTWTVAKLSEPTTSSRGYVATLAKVE